MGSALASKSASNSLLVRAAHKLLPHASLSPRFDPVFNDGPSLRQFRANWSAWRAFRGFRPERAVHVGVIADSRGGSHLVQSQFHYLPGGFCFGEGFTPHSPRALNFRAFLLRGEFGVNSLQSKRGRDISHLFYLLNNQSFPASPAWRADNPMPWPRIWLFLFRNPLRCLLSMDASGKAKWKLTADFAGDFLEKFRQRLLLSAGMERDAPDRVRSLCYERFVQQPGAMVEDICQFIGIDAGERATPQAFFRRLQRCGSAPQPRGGYLASPLTGERIEGSGGGFNPLSPIDPARAFTPPLKDAFPGEFHAPAAARLGQALFDLCMTERRSTDVDDLRAAAARR